MPRTPCVFSLEHVPSFLQVAKIDILAANPPGFYISKRCYSLSNTF